MNHINIKAIQNQMVNYQRGKIYKIHDQEGTLNYIGSTTKDYLCQRFSQNVKNYKCWKNGIGSRLTVYEIFDHFETTSCQITLIENVACGSKDELLARERHYIKTMECVNKCIPLRTAKEYSFDNGAGEKEGRLE